MKKKILILLGFLLMISFISQFATAAPKIVVTDKDKVLLQEKLNKFSKMGNLSTGELILKIGTDFNETPYVGKTLDNDIEENLVVNLRELDCTTFVENCIAIARTIKNAHPSFETFTSELEKIRYRDGHLNGYVSRLHYFGEWITDNSTKGIVADVTHQMGGIKCPVLLSFMSTHPGSYPQLKSDPDLVIKMKLIENKVSAKPFYYIPKEKIAECENKFLDGDIIALVTRIPGMDVSHVGILFKKDHHVFMLHASSAGGKVETTRVSLTDYLKTSKNTTGIFVVRAK